jgi:hypothetical protein
MSNLALCSPWRDAEQHCTLVWRQYAGNRTVQRNMELESHRRWHAALYPRWMVPAAATSSTAAAAAATTAASTTTAATTAAATTAATTGAWCMDG